MNQTHMKWHDYVCLKLMKMLKVWVVSSDTWDFNLDQSAKST